jgi:hypothetical protein
LRRTSGGTFIQLMLIDSSENLHSNSHWTQIEDAMYSFRALFVTRFLSYVLSVLARVHPWEEED